MVKRKISTAPQGAGATAKRVSKESARLLAAELGSPVDPTPGGVISVVAEELGVPENLVKSVVRYLGEQGFLPRGARGPGAPRYSPREVALVVLVTMGSAISHTRAFVGQIGKSVSGLLIAPGARIELDADMSAPFVDLVAFAMGTANVVRLSLIFGAGNEISACLDMGAEKPVYFGTLPKTPLAREVRISGAVLARIGKKLMSMREQLRSMKIVAHGLLAIMGKQEK